MANSVKKYVFVIDPRRCIDCRACLVACRAENNVPIPNTRIWVYDQGVVGEFPNLAQQFVPYNCMHCDNPPCVDACPSQATYKRTEDGIVVIDQEACIGCGLCLPACPYHVRYLNPVSGKADKCNACLQRRGERSPRAWRHASAARVFGDLNVEQRSRDRAAKPNLKAVGGLDTRTSTIAGDEKELAIGAGDSARRHVLSGIVIPVCRRCGRDVPGQAVAFTKQLRRGESEFDE
jgi:tetrathionate reductase subunit B